jgi:hypothetical protein
MNTLQVSEIKTDLEFSTLIPPLTPEELAGLEASLLTDGCRDALVVWEGKDILLDGHNRLRICNEHEIPFTTKALAFESIYDAQMWVINNQEGRRNLTPFARGELELKRKGIVATKAKETQGRRTDLLPTLAKS